MGAIASQITSPIVYSTVYSGEFPAQMASNAENVSIWWRHNVFHITGIILGESIMSIVRVNNSGIVRVFLLFVLKLLVTGRKE